ncbi:MAG: bacterial proteasome activator family protein [Streptosporangiales bacterium]
MTGFGNPYLAAQQQGEDGESEDSPQQVMVVGPASMAIQGGPQDGEEGGSESPADMIQQPAKVMRIGNMIRQLLEEVRAAPLDDKSRARLREIHRSSIKELEDGLSTDLVQELDRLSLPFTSEEVPSDAELRIAQAQLVGWLEGLFHGIQTALFAQQMAARGQLEQMRRALPPGAQGAQGAPQQESPQPHPHSGPYL